MLDLPDCSTGRSNIFTIYEYNHRDLGGAAFATLLVQSIHGQNYRDLVYFILNFIILDMAKGLQQQMQGSDGPVIYLLILFLED